MHMCLPSFYPNAFFGYNYNSLKEKFFNWGRAYEDSGEGNGDFKEVEKRVS